MTQSPPQIITSHDFLDWLQQEKISLAFTTYQTSRLLLVGVNKNGKISGFERLFDRAMGLYGTTEQLFLSTKYQLWQFNNVLKSEQFYQGYDKLYVPRIGYTTGDLDIHDITIDKTGRILFVCTLLNCLATVSQSNSCQPLWKPPFISQIINQDRCHLNGLAMVDGQPSYVTAVSQSDRENGWRKHRQDGGCVIDISSNEIVITGLSMPHSPRFYQGKLWLLNSGTGYFGYINLEQGTFEPIAFCPGYLRGLALLEKLGNCRIIKAERKDIFRLKIRSSINRTSS
jgi:protein O-GlcNAc transferase